MILCIAEKLSLAEAAGKVLADMRGVSPSHSWEEAKRQQYNQVGDVKFVWLDGHAFELAMPDHYLPDDVPKTAKGTKRWRSQDLPIVPKTWTIQPKEQKTRRLAMIEADLKRCDLVWHMGDPDEEGQLLVDECLQFYGYRGQVKRVLINDYNATPVKAALSNIKDNSAPMFRGWSMWALARSRYDWLFGLNGTRAMTLRGQALGYDGLLPVGSVQTPLLYIVRERDRLIECFKPIPYFTLSARIHHENGSFMAKWKAREDQAGLDSEGRLINSGEAKKLIDRLTGSTGKITAYSKTKKQQKAPITLSMNELQIEGFKKHGYSGDQVLKAAQTLYEAYKVMSYPRSDNRYLSMAKHADAPAVIAAVLKVRPDFAELESVLDASRKSDAFNDKKMEGTPHHGIIPTVPESPVDAAKCASCESTSRNTKAPAHFDDAMLIDCMMNIHKYVTDPAAKKRLKEGDGIGTTATRAPMIQDMKERELFIPAPGKKGSGKIMTSPAARALIDALPHDVKDPAAAAAFKSRLDVVANSGNPSAACAAFEADTVAWVTQIVEQSKTAEMTLPASTKPKAVSSAPADTSRPCTCGKASCGLKKALTAHSGAALHTLNAKLPCPMTTASRGCANRLRWPRLAMSARSATNQCA